MPIGRISRLVKDSGYGFILEDDQVEEIQFHWTAVSAGSLEQLTEGQRVEFDKQVDPRDEDRSVAIRVRLEARSGH